MSGKMMNPVISKTALLALNDTADMSGKPLESGKGDGSFYSTIGQLMNPAQKESFHKPTTLSQSGLPLEKGHEAYLESLRKGLLVKGRPLSEISLRREDLFVLKKIPPTVWFLKGEPGKVSKRTGRE